MGAGYVLGIMRLLNMQRPNKGKPKVKPFRIHTTQFSRAQLSKH